MKDTDRINENEISRMIESQTEEKKEQRRRHKKEFFERVGDFRYTDNVENAIHVSKGDMVIVKNGYGIPVGPFEVLGFEDNIGDTRLFLDWDCYWLPKRIIDVLAVITKI